jgi:uncharacterized protein
LDWATDMVWRIEGHSIASKEYASKHEYLEEFVKPFGARFLASERFRPTNIRSVHADGNTVIVLWDGRSIAIDGKPYENTYAFFMQMRDGKVVDMTALTDSSSLNELFGTRSARRARGFITQHPRVRTGGSRAQAGAIRVSLSLERSKEARVPFVKVGIENSADIAITTTITGRAGRSS